MWVCVLSLYLQNRWCCFGSHLERSSLCGWRQVNVAVALLLFWLVISITYTLISEYETEMMLWYTLIFITVNITYVWLYVYLYVATILSWSIMYLFTREWRRCIIGGMLYYKCSMSWAFAFAYALEVMSWSYGRDGTGTASWDAAPYLVGYAGRRHVICIHMHSLEIFIFL